MQRSIKQELEKLRDTERLLNFRLLYLYEKSEQLKKDALENRTNKKKAAQIIMRYKIIEKEIPTLEKQWFSVFQYILALESAVLWKEFYESLKMSAESMKKLNQRIEKLDPTEIISNAQSIMDEYRSITESLSAWSDDQGEMDEKDLMLILNGGKEKSHSGQKDLGENDQEEEMFCNLETKKTRVDLTFPSVPSTLGETRVKQLT